MAGLSRASNAAVSLFRSSSVSQVMGNFLNFAGLQLDDIAPRRSTAVGLKAIAPTAAFP
jgi:hypothetical protein